MRFASNKAFVLVISALAFAALAVAPRPSSGQPENSTDPALGGSEKPDSNGNTINQNQAYAQGYNQAYNQAYAQKQQALDQGAGQQSGGGCCSGGSGGA